MQTGTRGNLQEPPLQAKSPQDIKDRPGIPRRRRHHTPPVRQDFGTTVRKLQRHRLAKPRRGKRGNKIGIQFSYASDPLHAWITVVVMDVWHWTSLVVLLAYAATCALWTPMLPLTDAYALRGVARYGLNYGPMACVDGFRKKYCIKRS